MGATPKAKFEDRLKAMPAKPGVYIFRDAKDKVIYVGKAALLRTRVRSYFGSMHGFEQKTRRLVEQIADIDFILTGTVQEALLLEATLVKRHQPFFNVRLKDDKHYPYLKIDLKEQWPRVEITRRVLNDGARYFGPFASAGAVRRTLGLVKKLFPWRGGAEGDPRGEPSPLFRVLNPPLRRAVRFAVHEGGVRHGHPADDHVPRGPHGRDWAGPAARDAGSVGSSGVRASCASARPSAGDRADNRAAGDGGAGPDGHGRLRPGARGARGVRAGLVRA